MPIPTLPDLNVGTAARRGSVTVLPVFATTALPPADYELGTDAIAAGRLEIRELPRGATVAHLEARNRSLRSVLIVDGDHLIGARQNRMVTSSALIGGERSVALPVACVEQGRWNGRSEQFAADASSGSPRLRRIARMTVTRSLLANGPRRADQSEIWSQIAHQQRSLRVSSATSALAHTYAARATDIAGVADHLPYAAGAIGVAIGVGAELVSIDLFDRPETCQRYWRRLVEGAALEGLGVGPRSASLAGAEVQRLLAELRAADWSRVPPVGDGDELRAQTASAAGSLLLLDGRIVHFGAAIGDAPRGALDLGAAVMRHDLPASLASRFRIVGRIGVGGTKEVFRAEDRRGGPDVAIARIPGVDRTRFDAELALARRVESDHVPRILAAQVDEHGDGYLVMERCDGPSLAEIVGRGALPIADAAPIMVAFARGLSAIHQSAVLHRDVKLENVMLSSGDAGPRLKILDFGMSEPARNESSVLFSLAEIGGTLPYMAREVARGTEVDARSDVYAFGVCCYRMLTGEFPLPPRERESQFDYLARLRDSTVDAAALPDALPDAARAIIARMLDPERERRPFMPEVVETFERAFGVEPIAAPPRVAGPTRRTTLERAGQLAVPVTRAAQLVVAACPHAPLVVLASPDGLTTEVCAYGPDGTVRWTRQLGARFDGGLRADLDGDGVRELYLSGPGRVAALEASGNVRFVQALPAAAAHASLVALPVPARPRLALDGRALDARTGALRGALGPVYRGDGRQLVDAADPSGLSYNGLADQAFRGDHATAAAIVNHPGERQFQVAHLEQTRSGRIQVGVYGPGGARLHTLVVGEADVETGNLEAMSRVFTSRSPLFTPDEAPIALLGDAGRAVVIVPLLATLNGVTPTLVAFELPSGRELWRWRTGGDGGRALLADVAGDGRPQLVVGTGRSLVFHDPWTGHASAPLACTGLPVAFGDPFSTGFAHLITASRDGIELWRGPRCVPGAMAWTGLRGDLWRTGTLRSDGAPLGPV